MRGFDPLISQVSRLNDQLVATGVLEMIKMGTNTSSGVQPPWAPCPDGTLAQSDSCFNAHQVLLSSKRK